MDYNPYFAEAGLCDDDDDDFYVAELPASDESSGSEDELDIDSSPEIPYEPEEVDNMFYLSERSLSPFTSLLREWPPHPCSGWDEVGYHQAPLQQAQGAPEGERETALWGLPPPAMQPPVPAEGQRSPAEDQPLLLPSVQAGTAQGGATCGDGMTTPGAAGQPHSPTQEFPVGWSLGPPSSNHSRYATRSSCDLREVPIEEIMATLRDSDAAWEEWVPDINGGDKLEYELFLKSLHDDVAPLLPEEGDEDDADFLIDPNDVFVDPEDLKEEEVIASLVPKSTGVRTRSKLQVSTGSPVTGAFLDLPHIPPRVSRRGLETRRPAHRQLELIGEPQVQVGEGYLMESWPSPHQATGSAAPQEGVPVTRGARVPEGPQWLNLPVNTEEFQQQSSTIKDTMASSMQPAPSLPATSVPLDWSPGEGRDQAVAVAANPEDLLGCVDMHTNNLEASRWAWKPTDLLHFQRLVELQSQVLLQLHVLTAKLKDESSQEVACSSRRLIGELQEIAGVTEQQGERQDQVACVVNNPQMMSNLNGGLAPHNHRALCQAHVSKQLPDAMGLNISSVLAQRYWECYARGLLAEVPDGRGGSVYVVRNVSDLSLPSLFRDLEEAPRTDPQQLLKRSPSGRAVLHVPALQLVDTVLLRLARLPNIPPEVGQLMSDRTMEKSRALLRSQANQDMITMCLEALWDVLHCFYERIFPDIEPYGRGNIWSDAEDDLLAWGHLRYGTDWVAIHEHLLPGRSIGGIQDRKKNLIRQFKTVVGKALREPREDYARKSGPKALDDTTPLSFCARKVCARFKFPLPAPFDFHEFDRDKRPVAEGGKALKRKAGATKDAKPSRSKRSKSGSERRGDPLGSPISAPGNTGGHGAPHGDGNEVGGPLIHDTGRNISPLQGQAAPNRAPVDDSPVVVEPPSHLPGPGGSCREAVPCPSVPLSDIPGAAGAKGFCTQPSPDKSTKTSRRSNANLSAAGGKASQTQVVGRTKRTERPRGGIIAGTVEASRSRT